MTPARRREPDAPPALDRRLKIVHAAPSLNRGGGERLMIELANHQVRQGHDVTVLLGWRVAPDRAHDGLDARVTVRMIGKPTSGRRRMYLDLLPWLWRHRQWIAGQNVLHCHMTFGAVLGSAVQLISKASGGRRPIVVETDHAVGMPMPKLTRWVHFRLLARRDGLAAMVDHSQWRRLVSHSPAHSQVIPAGIPIGPRGDRSGRARRLARGRFGFPDEGRIVGTVGRMVSERRPWELLPVFARISETMPDVTFALGGDGPEEARVRRAIAEAGLEGRVHLIGLVRDLDAFFAACDLFVTTNMGPVPGVVGLQAVAAGVPTISVQFDDFGGAESNWLWASGDRRRVADKAVELLRSAERRDALARRQFDHLCRHHEGEAMAEAYLDFYRAVIAASGNEVAQPGVER